MARGHENRRRDTGGQRPSPSCGEAGTAPQLSPRDPAATMEHVVQLENKISHGITDFFGTPRVRSDPCGSDQWFGVHLSVRAGCGSLSESSVAKNRAE